MPCRTGCPTPGMHASWGECARASNLRVAYCDSVNGADATRQKRWDKELSDYKAARAQGIQPATTRTRDIRKALDVSDRTGVPFDATNPGGAP